MWFLFDVDLFIVILRSFSIIVFDYTYEQTVEKLWGKDTAAYKFPEDQIHLARLLANNTFPENFLFGIGTPIASNERTLHCTLHEESPSNVTKHINFNSHYKEDILLAKGIGAQTFEISLSWKKILPYGFANFIDEDAIKYYDNVIDEIIANDMTPMIILFDWDLPYNLEMLGGCKNPMFMKWFQDYARIAFGAFGNKVKFWVTINEANLMAYSDRNVRATAINQSGIADYLCGHYALLAHAKVYNMYNENFRRSQNGKIGIIQLYAWMELQNDEPQADVYGLHRAFEWHNGWLSHPIFSKSGDYPKLMRDRIDFKSLYQGFSRSRLPYFTGDEVRLIKGSADFLGINFYGMIRIRATRARWDGEASFLRDADIAFIPESDGICKVTREITASALDKLLERLNNDYILPEVYITENGYADTGEYVNNGEIVDINRRIYLRQHISQVMKAMRKGINIRGYLIWPLIDISARETFGLFHVDFDNGNLTRTQKSSSRFISEVYKTRTISSTAESATIIPNIGKRNYNARTCINEIHAYVHNCRNLLDTCKDFNKI